MTTTMPSEDPRKLWREQPLEGRSMSLKEVHSRIEKLGRQVRRRNLIGGIASITVLLGFAYFFSIVPDSTERIGAALTVIGAGYLMYQLILVKMKERRTAESEAQVEASVAFYRSELQRQRDFHQGIWFWSRLVVFTPGPFIFCIGLARVDPANVKIVVVEAALAAMLVIAAIPLNLRRARKYQREIDALDSAVS